MFGMLRAILTLLIVILIVGFYLGWFSFHRLPADPQSNKVDINVSVDQKKMGSDLHAFEQKVANRIQDINTQPPGKPQAPQPGMQPAAPTFNFGPVSVQPAGQPVPLNNGQPPVPGWSVGPISLQPPSQPAGPPQLDVQTQGFQFNVPLGAPPAPGEGR